MTSNVVVYKDGLISLTRIEEKSNEDQKLYHSSGTPYLQVCFLKPKKVIKDSFIFRKHEFRSTITNLKRALMKLKSDEAGKKKYKDVIRYVEESLEIIEKESELFSALFSFIPNKSK